MRHTGHCSLAYGTSYRLWLTHEHATLHLQTVGMKLDAAHTAVTRISRAVLTHPTIEKTMRPRHDVRHRVSQSQDSLQCTLEAMACPVRASLQRPHTQDPGGMGIRGHERECMPCYSVHSAQPLRTTQPARRIARNWKHVQQSHSKVTEADHGLPVPNSAVTHELPAWHDMHDHLASILRRSEL